MCYFKEAIIQEQFKEAVNALKGCNQQKSLKLFVEILLNPLMKEFYVQNWHSYDWEASETKATRILSNMSKIYFSVNIAIAGLVENPVSFYLQVNYFFFFIKKT